MKILHPDHSRGKAPGLEVVASDLVDTLKYVRCGLEYLPGRGADYSKAKGLGDMESLAEQKAEPKRPLEDAGDSRSSKRCVKPSPGFDRSLELTVLIEKTKIVRTSVP